MATSAVDNKPSGTPKLGDANAEQDPQTSERHRAGDEPRQYYRRLIRRKYMDPLEAANDPDLQDIDVPDSVWHRKLYGPDIKVITTLGIPPGWILVNRKIPSQCLFFFTLLIYRP